MLDAIQTNLSNPEGVNLYSHIETEAVSGITIHDDWIGFIHNLPKHPSHIQSLYGVNMSNEIFLKSRTWLKSQTKCKGLFVLSQYLKDYLSSRVDVPVNVLIHPSGTTNVLFDNQKFHDNQERKLIMVGHWLRNFSSLEKIQCKKYKKFLLKGGGVFYDRLKLNMQCLERVDNEGYDDLFQSNLIFLDLYDSSANNVVIECIMRNTPILINPLPAITEYLGKQYPLYFSSIEDAACKADDFALITEAHQYLLSMDKSKFSYDYFIESLHKSHIYRNLPQTRSMIRIL